MMQEVKKVLGKKSCNCGRKMVVARVDGRISSAPIPVCSYCTTYGLKESKRIFVQENAMIRKQGKTEFKITEGKLHINDWKKKK